MIEMKDKQKKITITQCINWLEDALYDMQCGKLNLGENLIQEVIMTLKDLDKEA